MGAVENVEKSEGTFTTWRKSVAIIVALGYFVPQLIRFDFTQGASAYLYDIATRVGYPVLSLWLLRRWLGISWSQIGIPPTVWGKYTKGEFFAYAFISTLWCMTVKIFESVLDSWDLYGSWHPAALGPHPVPVLVYLLLVAPVTEEIFYRGVLKLLLLSNKSSLLARTSYVAISALLFGAGHSGSGDFGMLSTAYFGAVAAIIYLCLGNIWIVVVAHFVWDFLVVVFYQLPYF